MTESPTHVHDLLDRTAGGRTVVLGGPSQRHESAGRDAPGKAQRPAGQSHRPERQRSECGAEADGPGAEQEVLHRGEDRAVVARRPDGGYDRACATEARHHDHRDLFEVICLPLNRVENALQLVVGPGPTPVDPVVHRPGLTVQPGELVLHVGIPHDDELPRLEIATARGLHRELEEAADGRVIDRIGAQTTNGALGLHRVADRHAEAVGDLLPARHASPPSTLSPDRRS